MGNTATEAELRAWLKKNGGYISSAVSLISGVRSEGTGGAARGVVATRAIAAGEQLAVVPQHLCVYMPAVASDAEAETSQTSNLSLQKVAEHIREKAPNLSPFLSTVLLLMHELGKGKDSPRQPYLATLPEEVGNLTSWSDEERTMLEGTTIADADVTLPDIWADEVKEIVTGGGDLWAEEQWTYDAFQRAHSLVQSRGFRMQQENWITGEVSQGEDLHLICAIDMLNHSSQPERVNTELAKVDERMEIKVEGGEQVEFRGFFGLKASHDIIEGEELMLSYGDLGDAELLRMYGFVELVHKDDDYENPNNKVMIHYDKVRRACEVSAAKVDTCVLMDEKEKALRDAGILQPTYYIKFIDDSGTVGVPDELVTAIIVLHMGAEEFAEYVATDPAEGEGKGGLAMLKEEHFQYLDNEHFKSMMKEMAVMANSHALEMLRYGITPWTDHVMDYREKCARFVAMGERKLFARLTLRFMQLLSQYRTDASTSGEEYDDSDGDSEDDSDEDSYEETEEEESVEMNSEEFSEGMVVVVNQGGGGADAESGLVEGKRFGGTGRRGSDGKGGGVAEDAESAPVTKKQKK